MEHTMFPLHQGSNDLVIQFSNSPHEQQHKISQDLILDNNYSSLLINDSDKIFSFSCQPNNELLYEAAKNHDNSNEQMRKTIHREIEKKRRQEMATYTASLRSLLPLEFIKGKRSISDHMNEAVNYIKHMQNNNKELGAKRDELKKLSNSKLENIESNHALCNLNVHQNNGILRIEFTSGLRKERLKLSQLLKLLAKEGLEVDSCVTTEINGRLIQSVMCEVNNSKSVDLFELRNKIATVIPTITCDSLCGLR